MERVTQHQNGKTKKRGAFRVSITLPVIVITRAVIAAWGEESLPYHAVPNDVLGGAVTAKSTVDSSPADTFTSEQHGPRG